MKMKKPVQVYVSSILKSCRNTANSAITPPAQLPKTVAKAIVGPPQLIRKTADSHAAVAKIFRSYSNPCLDLFYNVIPAVASIDAGYHLPEYCPMRNSDSDSHKYLKQVLPRAWDHNPLTTLKLICNFLDRRSPTGKDYCQEFYAESFNTAAYWLHQNHPRTLASNLPSIAGNFGDLTTALGILYQILQNGAPIADLQSEIRKGLGGSTRSPARKKKILELANKAVERYQIDPNYRFLHDRVSDLFADCLKFDIQSLSKHQGGDNGCDGESNCLEISEAAKWCPYIDSTYDRATLLCESIARKVFPRESEHGGGGVEEEAGYAFGARNRLKTEVLAPLRAALEESAGVRTEPCPVKKYLADLAAGKCEIQLDALLPNEIIRYANDGEVGAAAEMQWKAMVEEVYSKQGKFKNCLAVGDGNYHVESVEQGREVVVALQVLMSELCDEPWKGKAVNLRGKPRVEPIPSGGDLKSKIEFFRTDRGWIRVGKVFDVILEAAVTGNLKPDQMIKKVFVFSCTSDGDYDEFFSGGNRLAWDEESPGIRRKFEEKGYPVPEVVFWNAIRSARPAPVITKEDGAMLQCRFGFEKEKYKPFVSEGAVVMGGFNDSLFKTFLANDGGLNKEDVMESAVSGQEYQDLVVVD